MGLYDPSTSTFYLTNTLATGTAEYTFGYGAPTGGWTPRVGDWNSDGVTGVALFDPGDSMFHLTNTLSTGTAQNTFGYGVPNGGWTPLVGDWNGDGCTGVGLFDPTASTFYLTNTLATGTAELAFSYGTADAGWIPLVGVWASADTSSTSGESSDTLLDTIASSRSNEPSDLTAAVDAVFASLG